MTRSAGGCSYRSFSFGAEYDPENAHFGPLIANNDEFLSPGAGFSEHLHRDLEIVTWVVAGGLIHTDSTGATASIGAGGAAVLYAGTGVRHGEVAAEVPTRFVQMWLRLSEPSGEPTFAWTGEVVGTGLVPLAGPGATLPLRQRGALLYLARLRPGERVAVPVAEHLHIYAVEGEAAAETGENLTSGDALRITGAGAALTGRTRASLLVWVMD